jgi:glycosyltransferase involved in cell wall biosynthesis
MKSSKLQNTRIAIDARYLANPGMGINEYLVAMLRLLDHAGARLTLLTDRPLQIPDDLRHLTVRILNMRPHSPIVWEQLRLPLHLYRQRYDYFFAPANVGVPLLYVGRTRLVLTIHDLIPLKYFGRLLKKQPLRMLFYLPSTMIALLRAQRIIAVSSATASDIRHYSGRRARVTLIPLNYMGVTKKIPAGSNMRRKDIIYNGGMDERKNVRTLLRGFALFSQQNPEYRLVLMGKYYEQVQPLIDELQIAKRVHLTGYISDQEKLNMLSKSTAVVYPSSYEGYGLPIVEAMLTGAIAICGRRGSQEEIGGKGALFVDPITPQTIATVLIEAVTISLDPTVLKRYQQKQKAQLARLSGQSVEARSLAVFSD